MVKVGVSVKFDKEAEAFIRQATEVVGHFAADKQLLPFKVLEGFRALYEAELRKGLAIRALRSSREARSEAGGDAA